MRFTHYLFTCLFASTPVLSFAAETIAIDIPGTAGTVAKLGTLASIKKDNFEKTADFTKRVCAQAYKTLGVSEGKLVAIGLEQGQYATSARYNADKQAFSIHVAIGGNHFRVGDGYADRFQWNTNFDPYKHQGLRIAEEYRESPKSYTGTNAFGVSKDIKVGSETAAVFYFPSRGQNSLNIVLPSKPDEARRIENDLRVAVIGKIQSPCFVSGHGHKPPTITYTYDLALSEVGIVGAPNPEWVVYLDSTKQVLKRGKFR